jgi:hypothetical protein
MKSDDDGFEVYGEENVGEKMCFVFFLSFFFKIEYHKSDLLWCVCVVCACVCMFLCLLFGWSF